jgi:F-box and WD-40 domain protein 1/11
MAKFKPAEHILRTQGSIGGLGIGKVKPEQDWKKMYAIRNRIEWNWIVGNVRPAYLTGHTDSVYCVQFDE